MGDLYPGALWLIDQGLGLWVPGLPEVTGSLASAAAAVAAVGAEQRLLTGPGHGLAALLRYAPIAPAED